jgi:hypothetical protein
VEVPLPLEGLLLNTEDLANAKGVGIPGALLLTLHGAGLRRSEVAPLKVDTRCTRRRLMRF